MIYSVNTDTGQIGEGSGSISGGTDFEGTFEEVEQFVHNNRTLQECKIQKVKDLIESKSTFMSSHPITFSRSGVDYGVKFSKNTKENASDKGNLIRDAVVASAADKTWFADYDENDNEGLFLVEFQSAVMTKSFLTDLGNKYQDIIQVYLLNKQIINSKTTVAQVEAIDVDAIDWGTLNIGDYEDA